MPRLREITSSENLSPSGFRSDPSAAAGAAGNILGAVGEGAQQLGQAVTQRAERNETSMLSAEFAKAQAELTVQWEETQRTADPNDGELSDRFLAEVVSPRLDQINEKAESGAGRNLVTRARGGLEASLFQRTKLDQASLAGVAARENYETSQNQLSTATFADPQSFAANRAMLDFALGGAVEDGISTADALKLKTAGENQLARAAVLGMMEADAEEGMLMLASGQFDEFIDGTTRRQLENAGEQMLRAEDAERRAQVAEAERVRQRVSENTRIDMMATLIDPETGAVTLPPNFAKDVLTNERLDAADQSAMFTLYRTLSAAGANSISTNQQVFTNAIDRALLEPGDPNRMTQGELASLVGRGITSANYNFIQGLIDGKDNPAFKVRNDLMKQTRREVRSTIAPSKDAFGNASPAGEAAYTRFESWFSVDYQRRVQTGADPIGLLTPGHKDFMLGKDVLDAFRPTVADDFEAMMRRNEELIRGVKAATEKPKLSPEEFLKQGN